MALLGSAAMLLWFDIVPEQVADTMTGTHASISRKELASPD